MPDVRAEVLPREQVNGSPDEFRELTLHAADADQRHVAVGCELHEDVHVAVRAKILPEDRAEQPQAQNPMLTAERGDPSLVD